MWIRLNKQEVVLNTDFMRTVDRIGCNVVYTYRTDTLFIEPFASEEDARVRFESLALALQNSER